MAAPLSLHLTLNRTHSLARTHEHLKPIVTSYHSLPPPLSLSVSVLQCSNLSHPWQPHTHSQTYTHTQMNYARIFTYVYSPMLTWLHLDIHTHLNSYVHPLTHPLSQDANERSRLQDPKQTNKQTNMPSFGQNS